MKKQRPRTQRLSAMLGLILLLGMFGRAEAAAPTVPTIAVNPSTLTPYSSGGCVYVAPCYEVRGTTDPAMKVTVTATDEFGKTVTVTTYAAERTDIGTGINAGDYIVAPNVTGLGTHTTTPSLLSFTAFAENALGEKSAVSAPVVVTKVAAAAGDLNPPTLTVVGSTPPGMACGTGWCNFNSCSIDAIRSIFPGQPAKSCTGFYKMSGSSEDNNATAYGLASEIADVVLTVKDSSGNVVKTLSAIGTRRGTQGYWSANIYVADYAVGQSYTWSLVAIDAAGNTSAARTGSFTRYPL